MLTVSSVYIAPMGIGEVTIRRIILAIYLLSGLVPMTAAAAPGNLAIPAFQKLQSLAGEWHGTDDRGKAVRTEFQSSVSRTVVMEVLTPADMPPMMTLYSLDGEAVALVHYCATNNQPRMRAVPDADPAKELRFDFLGAGIVRPVICAASAVVKIVRAESYRVVRRLAIRLRVVFRLALCFVCISWPYRQTTMPIA
jgi:hypothetical protein